MSKRILVVEDQEDNRRIVRDLLVASGYELIEATTGEEGLALAERETARPDPDGHPAAGAGRLRGHAPDQGQPGLEAISRSSPSPPMR